MFAILSNILSFILGLFARGSGAKKPSPIERAAVAETKLETMEATDAAVTKAIDARRAADARVVRDASDVRKPDKYSRD